MDIKQFFRKGENLFGTGFLLLLAVYVVCLMVGDVSRMQEATTKYDYYQNLIYLIENIARKVNQIDFTKPARTGLVTKFKFYAVRMMQTGLGKDDPEYADYKYWNANGWIGTERPWK